LLLALAAAVVVVVAAPAAAQLPEATHRRIDRVFARWDRRDSPGCALGVSRQGKPVYVRGYGMSDLQHGVPITPASIFHVGSVSKQVTAYAVALLAEDGRLSLDDDVRRYVPEVPDLGAVITIRQLIEHTSGLRDQWQLLRYAGWREDDLVTEGDILGIVARQQGLNFSPGAEWLYSNTGYTLLGVIVRRVSGRTLRAFAQDRIFAPLGMRATHFQDDHTEIVPGRTSAYAPRAGGGWKLSVPVFDTDGATSLFTTPGDLLAWMANFDVPTVGSRALAAAGQRTAVLTDGTPTGYGYGLTLGTYRGLAAVGHYGADAGYRAQVERYPARGLAIAVLCTGGTTDPGALLHAVADVLLGSTAPAPRLAFDTVPRPASAAARHRWVGVYRDTLSHAVLRVRLAGGALRLGDGRPLVTTGDTSARVGATDAGLVLHTTAGVATGLTQLPRTTRDLRFRRVPAFAPTHAALAGFAGAYVSDELDVRYDLTLVDSSLVLRHRKLPDMRLEPAFADAFSLPFGTVLEFTRDAAGQVRGFALYDGRVRGVRFDRVR
jgi:CubicO group peptidase (beta-lactamase class C family)